MNIYILVQKPGKGCPTGKLDAALYDKFYEDRSAVEHGYFPWYANATRMRPHEKFPIGMVLIGKSETYKFSVRSIARDLYVISQGLLDVCRSLDVPLRDVEGIDVCTESGDRSVDEAYYLTTFEAFPAEDIVLPESLLTIGKYGRIEAFTSLVLDVSKVGHIFRVLGLSAHFSTLFCSDVFKEKAEQAELNGIEFIPLAGNCSDDVSPI